MARQNDPAGSAEFVCKGFTLRDDQVEDMDTIAHKVDGHGNRSRVVREALDEFIASRSREIAAVRAGATIKRVIVHNN